MKTGQLRGHYCVVIVCVCFSFAKVVRGEMLNATNDSAQERTASVLASTNLDLPPFAPLFTASPISLTGAFAVVVTSPYTAPPSPYVAELKQEVREALESKRYRNAQKYATMGLEVSPRDAQFLKAKAFALNKLNRLPEAIAAYKDALTADPNAPGVVNNLAELLLITGQISEYENLKSTHKQEIDAAFDGMLSKYFSLLEVYQTGDVDKLREITTKLLATLPTGKKPRLDDWDFAALLSVIPSQPDSPKKVMFMAFVRVLSGEVSRDEGLKLIKGR